MVYAANTTAVTATTVVTASTAVTTTNAAIATTVATSSNWSWRQVADHRTRRHHPDSGHDVDDC
jgi:hypothetical protein